MSGIKVNYETIQVAAEDCKSTGAELEALFEQLKSNLAPLTSEWEGEAMAAWQELQQNWDRSLDDLKQVLAQIATALPQIADSYQGTEQGIKGMFG
ncbi:WXG100 family type VII secretion target [Prauserella halophila]|uniref:ESAT-6-like protein n=2 Tax=Prauserella halophila TaxID=185641 RepID=A0ABP4GYX2_9PSEU|nr:WXG100 family type VII secretion target [Prauserella halophila]